MKSGLKSPVFDKFAQAAGTIINPSIQQWQKQGGRVIGYTCSFVPEELFIAAGIVPFRIRGTESKNADLAGDYFEAANICSFVRHCFNQILLGEYSFLDGAVIGGGCDANRHLLDNWAKSSAKLTFLDRIFFPHASGELMSLNFRDQLATLKKKLEVQFDVEITDQKLWAAIKLCNETRALQRELYDLRKAANPPITGAETIAVILAGSSLPKEEYNADLKTLLNELRGVKVPDNKYKVRLMIVGPGYDETSMCDIVEGLGGLVVSDLTCFDGKVIFGSVAESGTDPLQAMANYQVIDRPLCPKNLSAHALINKIIFQTVKDFKVNGVIGQNFLCCETWGGELYLLDKELKESGIPLLRIEREYIPDSLGQLQTRVQAFIETLSGDTL